MSRLNNYINRFDRWASGPEVEAGIIYIAFAIAGLFVTAGLWEVLG